MNDREERQNITDKPRDRSIDEAFKTVSLDVTKLSDELLEELYRLIAEELKRRGYIA